MQEKQRTQPFILRTITGPDEEEAATVRDEGRELLLLPLTRDAAQRCLTAPRYAHLDMEPVTVEDVEEVCRNHNLSLVALDGLEPESLSVVSVEVLPLVLTRESDASHL